MKNSRDSIDKKVERKQSILSFQFLFTSSLPILSHWGVGHHNYYLISPLDSVHLSGQRFYICATAVDEIVEVGNLAEHGGGHSVPAGPATTR